MKNLLSILIILIACFAAKGQDQIITKAGDTLNCKITRISADYIHFQINDIAGPIRSRIALDKVLSYSKTSVDEPEVQVIEDQTESTDISQRFGELIESDRMRLALNAGFTYQFGGYEGRPQSYTRQIRSMWSWGGEFHYLFWSNLGFGVKYNKASTPVDDVINGNRFIEDVRFRYVGFSVLFTQPGRDQDVNIYYQLSGGEVKYRDDGTINGTDFFEEGRTFALTFEIGYDYRLSTDYAVGVGFGINIARINEISSSFGPTSAASFDISRFDLTLGFRFLK